MLPKAPLTIARKIVSVIVLASLGAVGHAQTPSAGIHPDAVYYDAKVITVDKNFTISQAFAVLGEKFIAVGSNRAMLALAGPQTKRVDLHSRGVIPGLIDDHYHYLSNAGNDFKDVSLVRAKSLDEFLEIIKHRADEMSPGTVMSTQSGWLPDQFNGRLPNKTDLDKAAPRNPLFVRGGHTMYLNSAALKLAGIDRNTPTPPGGVIGKDMKSGDVTGELIDNAAGLANKFMPRATEQDKVDGLRKAQKLLNSVGLTSVRDPGVDPADIRIYQQFWDRDELTVRVSTNLSLPSNPPATDILAKLSEWGVHTRFGDNKLRLDGIGEFGIDGGFQAALMREPYEDSPDVGPHEGPFFGLQRIPTDKFTDVIRGMNKLGWRACVHAVGDKAIDIVLDAYEKANQDSSIVDKRWTIEHGMVVRPDQMERIKRLGVIVSSQYHTYMASRTMIQDWGVKRGGQGNQTRQLLDAGIRVGVGTDWTLMPPNPFEVLYFLVTRKNRYGEPAGLEQRVTRQEALRLATVDNAYITFEENIKGSIEAGKLADFVVVDRDYMTIPEEQIKDIGVLMTVVGGKVAFEKGQ